MRSTVCCTFRRRNKLLAPAGNQTNTLQTSERYPGRLDRLCWNVGIVIGWKTPKCHFVEITYATRTLLPYYCNKQHGYN